MCPIDEPKFFKSSETFCLNRTALCDRGVRFTSSESMKNKFSRSSSAATNRFVLWSNKTNVFWNSTIRAELLLSILSVTSPVSTVNRIDLDFPSNSTRFLFFETKRIVASTLFNLIWCKSELRRISVSNVEPVSFFIEINFRFRRSFLFHPGDFCFAKNGFCDSDGKCRLIEQKRSSSKSLFGEENIETIRDVVQVRLAGKYFLDSNEPNFSTIGGRSSFFFLESLLCSASSSNSV